MRRVFIDGGAYNGNSTQLFLNSYPDADHYEIHSFEPNRSIHRIHGNSVFVTLHKVAIWIRDGSIKFYLSENITRDGSTLIKEKKTGLRNIYRSPKDIATLEKVGRWTVVQVVKAFLGMPIIPGR